MVSSQLVSRGLLFLSSWPRELLGETLIALLEYLNLEFYPGTIGR